MADDFDVETMLEETYRRQVSCVVQYRMHFCHIWFMYDFWLAMRKLS